METFYQDCDRCGDQVKIEHGVKSFVEYKNALLCLRCAKIRNFDDDNPVMYPIHPLE